MSYVRMSDLAVLGEISAEQINRWRASGKSEPEIAFSLAIDTGMTKLANNDFASAKNFLAVAGGQLAKIREILGEEGAYRASYDTLASRIEAGAAGAQEQRQKFDYVAETKKDLEEAQRNEARVKKCLTVQGLLEDPVECLFRPAWENFEIPLWAKIAGGVTGAVLVGAVGYGVYKRASGA